MADGEADAALRALEQRGLKYVSRYLARHPHDCDPRIILTLARLLEPSMNDRAQTPWQLVAKTRRQAPRRQSVASVVEIARKLQSTQRQSKGMRKAEAVKAVAGELNCPEHVVRTAAKAARPVKNPVTGKLYWPLGSREK